MSYKTRPTGDFLKNWKKVGKSAFVCGTFFSLLAHIFFCETEFSKKEMIVFPISQT